MMLIIIIVIIATVLAQVRMLFGSFYEASFLSAITCFIADSNCVWTSPWGLAVAWLVVVAVRWIMILVRHGDVSHLMHVAFKHGGLRAGLFYAVFAPWTRLQVRVAIAWGSLEMPYSKLFVHTLTNAGLSVHKTDQALTEQERNQCVHNLVVLSCVRVLQPLCQQQAVLKPASSPQSQWKHKR